MERSTPFDANLLCPPARPSFAEFVKSVTKYFSEITMSLCNYNFTRSKISEHCTALVMILRNKLTNKLVAEYFVALALQLPPQIACVMNELRFQDDSVEYRDLSVLIRRKQHHPCL